MDHRRGYLDPRSEAVDEKSAGQKLQLRDHRRGGPEISGVHVQGDGQLTFQGPHNPSQLLIVTAADDQS